MKKKVFLSYFCMSTALCSFSPMVWGMEDDNKGHLPLLPNKEKQELQDDKEDQEKNKKKSFHKLTGRSLTMQLSGEETRFYEEEVSYDGDCGYSALGTNRQATTELLLQNIHREAIRNLIAPEIYDMLPQLPKKHPVKQFQAYQLNLGQQKNLARQYQAICTTLNDYFRRPEKNRWNGDQLWQSCQQNLNAIQNNFLQNQSYETFQSLREQIKQNEEERMQFCSQKETVESYIKNFMQTPVNAYYTQYGDNNWLNYSPVLMHNQKYRPYAINAIARLLGKNLVIVDEVGNIKHHYLCSEAPITKENTLFLCHIGNYHFNKLVFLAKGEEVEYFTFLCPKPILKEEIQDHPHEKKKNHLFHSLFRGLIHCPMVLDEGLKDLQHRLRQKVVLRENKLKSLQAEFLQIIKGISPGDLKNKLKEFVSSRHSPQIMGVNPSTEECNKIEEGKVGIFFIKDDLYCKVRNKEPLKIQRAGKDVKEGLNSECFERIRIVLKGHTLRLMGKDPSQELLQAIKRDELGVFFKGDKLYCKVHGKEQIEIKRAEKNSINNFNAESFDRIIEALKNKKSKHLTKEDEALLLEFTRKTYTHSNAITNEDKIEVLESILLNGYIASLPLPEEQLVMGPESSLGLEIGLFYAQKQEKAQALLSHSDFKNLDERIALCENLANQLESQNLKKASTVLDEIKSIYEEYKKGFLTFNPENMKEDYQKHLAPKIEFYGTLIPPALILKSLSHLLASRTSTNQLDKKNKDGTHPVYPFEDSMHFKAYDSNVGLKPGKELAMYHLYRLLAGGGVAPSTLCLAELSFADKTKQFYPLQVSSTIKGLGFHRFLQNYFFAEWRKENLNTDPKDYLQENSKNGFMLGFQERFRDKTPAKNLQEEGCYRINAEKWHTFLKKFNPEDWMFDHIDEDSLARMTLMSFLTDPGDAKADNFMLYRENDKDKWQVISIDTDRVFEPNFKKFKHENKEEKHQVHHKSIFYTLPFFMKEKKLSQKVKDSVLYMPPCSMKEKELSQEDKNKFKKNLPLTLARWLLTLREENKAYDTLRRDSALPERIYTEMNLPITLKKGQISTLLSRLETLQKIFRQDQELSTLTLDDVFKELHPLLHAYYTKLQKEYPDDPLSLIYEVGRDENKLMRNKLSEANEPDQDLSVEGLFSKEELTLNKDEENRSFANTLEDYHERVENPNAEESPLQTIDEALEELSYLIQHPKGQAEPVTLLDLALEAKDVDLLKQLINAQGPQTVRASLGRNFYKEKIKNAENKDPELLKAWELLVNHHNSELHWFMGLENLFLTPEEAKAYEQKNEKLFKIIGASEGEKYLPQEVRDELFNEKNEFKRQNDDGVHAVGKASRKGYTLYFKYLPKLPGLEEAVGRWTRKLIGFGAPYVELFRLEDDLILVSQEIKGLTLKETIQQYPERLKQLDQKSLGQLLLSRMLINPEDERPDNIIVEQISKEPLKYRLIIIDNDQALVPTIPKPPSKVQVKSILYCFDQMDTLIDEGVREHFKSFYPYNLLYTWLKELEIVDGNQINLLKNSNDNGSLVTKLFEKHDSYVGIPFKEGDLSDFYDRFCKLQRALHNKNKGLPI